MRVIKFRAWHKKNRTMIQIFDTEHQTEWFLPNLSESYDVMQYTGLKDKNNKEIFEGDILKVPDLYETPENTSIGYHYEQVIFANYGFGTNVAMFYEDENYISEECEVVGNIHEDQELLNA